MSESQFLYNSLAPLQVAIEEGVHFSGQFFQGSLSPSLGLESISGRMGLENVFFSYKDVIASNEAQGFFIKSRDYLLPGDPDTNYTIDSDFNILSYHNLEPNIIPSDTYNTLEVENIIVSFAGEDSELDMKNFAFANFNIFLDSIMEIKTKTFNNLVPFLDGSDTSIMSEEVANTDTFYTKVIPFNQESSI